MFVMKHLLINFESNIKNLCFLKKYCKTSAPFVIFCSQWARMTEGFLSLDTGGGAMNTVIFFILWELWLQDTISESVHPCIHPQVQSPSCMPRRPGVEGSVMVWYLFPGVLMPIESICGITVEGRNHSLQMYCKLVIIKTYLFTVLAQKLVQGCPWLETWKMDKTLPGR